MAAGRVCGFLYDDAMVNFMMIYHAVIFLMILIIEILVMIRTGPIIEIIIIIVIIMVIKWGVGTRCVPTPKMAYFSVFKAFLFLKYFKNNLGLIESSFNP